MIKKQLAELEQRLRDVAVEAAEADRINLGAIALRASQDEL